MRWLFKSRADAESWYNSPEYQAIRPLRLAAIEGYAVLVDEFNPSSAQVRIQACEMRVRIKRSSQYRHRRFVVAYQIGVFSIQWLIGDTLTMNY